ncbi:hypothetical protein HFP72_31300 [Nocardiopsis sp. ARC36]
MEDIAHIIARECSGNLHIDFHDDRERFGSEPADIARYAEVDGTPENLKGLTLTGKRGETVLTLDFSGWRPVLVILNPDNSIRGAAVQIRDICKANHRSKWTTFLKWAFGVWTALFLLYYLLFSLIFWGWGSLLYEVTYILGSTAIFASVALVLARIRVPSRALLINMPRSERPSWWQRHRKDAALLLIGGVVGYLGNQLPELVEILGR